MALGRRPENGAATTLAAVVCDGVSTVRRPELASHTAATVALDALLAADGDAGSREFPRSRRPPPRWPGSAPRCTGRAVVHARRRAGRHRDGRDHRRLGGRQPRLLARPRTATARLLTADHSWAAEMVAGGHRRPGHGDARPARARHHPLARRRQRAGAGRRHADTRAHRAPAALHRRAVELRARGPRTWPHWRCPWPRRATGARAAASALTAAALDAGGRGQHHRRLSSRCTALGGARHDSTRPGSPSRSTRTCTCPRASAGSTRSSPCRRHGASVAVATRRGLEIIIVDCSTSMSGDRRSARPAAPPPRRSRSCATGSRSRVIAGTAHRRTGLPGDAAPPPRTAGPGPRRPRGRRGCAPTAAPRSAPG